MTNKIIITNKLNFPNRKLFKKRIEHNEDDAHDFTSIIGKKITIKKPTVNKRSGIVHVFFPAVLGNDYQTLLTGSSNVQILNLESKSSQGISIKNFSDTTGDNLPYMYMGDISPYPQTTNERFAPFLKFSELGVLEPIKKDNVLLVYDDTIQEYDHKSYLGKQQIERELIYPVITGSRYSSLYETNSTIEIFEIRNQMFGTTNANTLKNSADKKYRNFFSGITVDIVGAHTMRKNGSNIMISDVIDKLELNLRNSAPYNDINQKEPIQINLKPIDYDGEYVYTFKPFDELRGKSYLDNKYDFAQSITSINDLLYGSDIKPPYSRMSEIGTRYQSATSGFIYDSTTIGSTTLGTDSIAFGGLKGG